MARPKGIVVERNFDEKDRTMIFRCAQIGMKIDQIAHLLNVSPKTFQRIIERDEVISDLLQKGKADGKAAILNTAFEMAVSGKNPAMTIFWLKVQERWSEVGNSKPDIDEDDQAKKITFTLNYSPLGPKT